MEAADGTGRPAAGVIPRSPGSAETTGAGEGGALPHAPMALSGGGEGVHAEMEAGLEGGGDSKE